MSNEIFLSRNQAANYMGTTPSMLNQWDNDYLPFIRDGYRVYYSLAAIEKFIDESLAGPNPYSVFYPDKFIHRKKRLSDILKKVR